MSHCLSSQCAVGHEYVADVGKHSSQTDAAQGFGGKFGVQRDRADKVRWTEKLKSVPVAHAAPGALLRARLWLSFQSSGHAGCAVVTLKHSSPGAGQWPMAQCGAPVEGPAVVGLSHPGRTLFVQGLWCLPLHAAALDREPLTAWPQGREADHLGLQDD